MEKHEEEKVIGFMFFIMVVIIVVFFSWIFWGYHSEPEMILMTETEKNLSDRLTVLERNYRKAECEKAGGIYAFAIHPMFIIEDCSKKQKNYSWTDDGWTRETTISETLK